MKIIFQSSRKFAANAMIFSIAVQLIPKGNLIKIPLISPIFGATLRHS